MWFVPILKNWSASIDVKSSKGKGTTVTLRIPLTLTIIEGLLTHMDGHLVGFVVDEVIGQHQTVIKNLGYLYQDIKEISGATILGNSTLALILDVSNLIQETRDKVPQSQECVSL